MQLLRFFIDMGSTILCRVLTGILYVLRIAVPLSVVAWKDLSGCINT